MPLPPGPPREWRPIIERGLAIFNALAAIYLALYGAAVLSVAPARMVTDSPLIVVPIPLLALVGFLAHGPRWLRLWLTLPSGPLWIFLGLILPVATLGVGPFANYRTSPQHVLYFVAPLALALLLLGAGALTIRIAFIWLRRL
jgi:hypothetical protein